MNTTLSKAQRHSVFATYLANLLAHKDATTALIGTEDPALAIHCVVLRFEVELIGDFAFRLFPPSNHQMLEEEPSNIALGVPSKLPLAK